MLGRLLQEILPAEDGARSTGSDALAEYLGAAPDPETVELCVRFATVDVLAAASEKTSRAADPDYPYLKVFAPRTPYGAQLEAAEPDALIAVGLHPDDRAVTIAWLGADGSEGEVWFWMDDGEARHALFYEYELLPIDPAAGTAEVLEAALTGDGPFADHWKGFGSPTAFELSPRPPGTP